MEPRFLAVQLPRHNSQGEIGVARSLSARARSSSPESPHSPPLRFSPSPPPSPHLSLRWKYICRRVSSARASQKRCCSEQQGCKTRRLAPSAAPRRQSMFDVQMRSSLSLIITRVSAIKKTFRFKPEELNFEEKKKKLQVLYIV